MKLFLLAALAQGLRDLRRPVVPVPVDATSCTDLDDLRRPVVPVPVDANSCTDLDDLRRPVVPVPVDDLRRTVVPVPVGANSCTPVQTGHSNRGPAFLNQDATVRFPASCYVFNFTR